MRTAAPHAQGRGRNLTWEDLTSVGIFVCLFALVAVSEFTWS